MALSALMITGFAKAQTQEAFPSYVEVNASAEKEVAPDTFYIRIDIDELDSKGKKSLDQMQNDMMKTLRQHGIDTEKQLVRLSLNSSYFNRKNNMASASYQLKLNDAVTVAKVWQSLDALGLSRISFVKAEYSKIDSLRNEARKEAMLNARSQASIMAEAVGQTIGKCFYINGGYSGNSVVYAQPRLKSMAYMADSVNAAPEQEENIQFDNIKITANVSAKFVLE